VRDERPIQQHSKAYRRSQGSPVFKENHAAPGTVPTPHIAADVARLASNSWKMSALGHKRTFALQ
jgi:hypothetical protein